MQVNFADEAFVQKPRIYTHGRANTLVDGWILKSCFHVYV